METNKPTSLSRRSAIGGMGAAMALPLVGPTTSPTAKPVEGKVALVTGSGRNLGRAAVLELARRGADVVVDARSNREEAEAVAREAEALGVRAIALLADVGDEEQVNQMVAEALERFGRIDILINNAGFRGSSSIADMTGALQHPGEPRGPGSVRRAPGPDPHPGRAYRPRAGAREYLRVPRVRRRELYHGSDVPRQRRGDSVLGWSETGARALNEPPSPPLKRGRKVR